MTPLLVIGLGALVIAAFLLPYEWWRKAPSRRPDTLLGKLLPNLQISLRNVLFRCLFVLVWVLVFVHIAVFLPIFLGLGISLLVLQSTLQRIRGGNAEPVLGLIVIALLGCLFVIGMFAPLRLLPLAGYLLLGKPAGDGWEALSVGVDWVSLDRVIGVAGLLGVASWLLADGLWRSRQARQVENLATSRIGALALGLVEVVGRVRPAAGSGAGCPVEVSYNMFTYWSPQQRVEPFLLEDDTGSVLVDARECRVRVGWISELRSIFGAREIVLTRRIERDEFVDGLTRTLAYGDGVYVIGNAERDGGGNLVIRPASRARFNDVFWKTWFGSLKAPRAQDIHDVFFLTDGGERAARRHISRGFGNVLILGLTWTFSALLLLYSTQLPWRQNLPLDGWRNAHWRGPQPNPNPGIIDTTRNQRLFRFERYARTLGPESHDQIPALLEAMSYDDYRFYEPATKALLRLSVDQKEELAGAVPALLGQLNECRYNAVTLQTTIRSLAWFGPLAAPAVPKLVEQLSCAQTNTYEVSPEIIRLQAARALGQIGPAAESAVPALLALQGDRAGGVRDAARQALRQIAGTSRVQ